MSTTVEKIAKHIQWELDQHQTPGPHDRPALDVEHLTRLISAQSRREPKRVRPEVKAELERLATTGHLLRWADRWPLSYRRDRQDQYFIVEPATARSGA